MSETTENKSYQLHPKLVKVSEALDTPNAKLCGYLKCYALEAFCRCGFMSDSPLGPFSDIQNNHINFIVLVIKERMKSKKAAKVLIANMERWLMELNESMDKAESTMDAKELKKYDKIRVKKPKSS